MRLTKNDKEAFVRAVMADVPQIDYRELAADYAQKEVAAFLPPKVREIWEDASMRGWIASDWSLRLPVDGYCSVRLPSIDNKDKFRELLKIKFDEWGAADRAQEDATDKLRYKVSSMIAACTTLKQARELLPEFVKYLPAERVPVGTAGVPIVANVVSDLVAAGWPKGSENGSR